MERRRAAQSDPGRRGGALLDREAYRTLSDFRYFVRRFLEFSQTAARRSGLPARQHQALLAIKGFPSGARPTISDLAERLRIQHHTAVGLVDRLAGAGLITRTHDLQDRRRVLLDLTEAADLRLARLAVIHLTELASVRPVLARILGGIMRLPEVRHLGTEALRKPRRVP